MTTAPLNISILLVDDDAMVLDVIKEYLESFGFTRVLATKSPQKALQKIQDPMVPIDLVLSDWEMPEVNGLTILKAVRKNVRREKTKFVMITSQRSMERFKISQAAQWQVSAYIVKPFTSDTLKEKIWSVMGWNKDEELKTDE